MTLTPGTRLGTYEIVGTLGAGGMGEVYRARDVRLGRDVAVKVLPGQVTVSPDRLARLEREARTVAGLNHPNIVTLHSIEDEDGVRFLTMELVEGQSLDRLIAAGGLPLSSVLELAIPLTGALIAAHERGVVHRDLKPSNVMVTRDRWVKVLDFGLAKSAAPTHGAAEDLATIGATQAISVAGQVIGTVPYMAPEQIRGEAVDARTDLFALGIMLYEMATGKRPFAGATQADLSSSILRDIPVPAVQLRADLPRDLNRVIARCLEKDPRDRIQTARDVHNELRYIQREIAPGAMAQAPAAAASPTAAPASASSAGAAAHASVTSPVSSPPVSPWPTPSSAAPVPSSAPATAPAREAPSIAVLPFVNRSRAEEDEYFSDGLADELLSVLSKIRGLRVVARASSFQFRGKNEDLAVIGEKLKVATLLDGSVRKSGNRVRISVQLVRAADGAQLWAETYDRSLEDIFAVQDDIAQSVVKELRTTLLEDTADSDASGRVRAEVAAAVIGHGQNPEAHRLYLQGKYFVGRMTGPDTARGIQYLEQALALDPTHAAAWSTLSRAHTNTGGYGWRPPVDAFRSARDAAMRALELAPGLAEAHSALCTIQLWHDLDWAGAERSARRALELAPDDPAALRACGAVYCHTARFIEAEAPLLRAIDQDPLNTDTFIAIALVHRGMGRLEDAERDLERAVEINPQEVRTRYLIAWVLAERGLLDEALATAMDEPAEWARLTALAYVHHKAGRVAEANDALRDLEAKFANESGYQIAGVHAARGEIDAAFEWLDRAHADRDAGVSLVKSEPCFTPLHGDPRWAALLRKLGLDA